MWKYVVITAAIVIALALQACAPKSQDSCGFVQNVYGERISWKGNLPVTLYLHESVPEDYIVSIEEAAKIWETATGKKLFTIRREKRISGPKTPLKDGQNVIYFMQQGEWEADKLDEQARTSIYWVGDQMKEADMRINGRYQFYPTATTAVPTEKPNAINMEALMVHELGHILGLKHKDADSSVMATFLSNNTDRTKLADSDLSAISCEY